MVAILASLVIAGAGVAALASIIATVRAQAASVARVLRDSRNIAQDREFLIRITATPALAPRVTSALARPRRLPRAAVRRPASATPQRAAA